MLYMIYTCNLYMALRPRFIFLVFFAFFLALSFAQDSPQIPTTPQLPQQTPPPLSSAPEVTQTKSPSHQSSHNSGNSQNSANIVTNNANIVAENTKQKVQVPQSSHVDPQMDHQQHHQVNQEQTGEHHQSSEHHDQYEPSRAQIRKMLSEMTQQQLAAFQDGLQEEARQYYRQIMAEDAQHQHQEQLEYAQQYAQVEEQLTKTDIESAKESEQFQKQAKKYENQLIAFNDYLFELDADQTETFRITIPVAQRIVVHGYTYENDDGVYTVTKDVEEHQPIILRIYENDQRMVYQKQFYFKYYGSFMGNENSTYILRFYNPSFHKLIALSVSTIFQKGHIADKVTVNDVADHSRRIKIFQMQLHQRYDSVNMRSGLQNSNRESLMKRLDHYYIFSYIELVVLLGMCLVQVEFIKKILSNNNIV